MKKLLAGIGVALVAAVWMTGSSFFFNSIAVGAEGSGAPAVAEKGHWGHHRGGHCGHHHHFWKKLNLTDDQKKEMFAIRLDERAKMKPLFQKLKEGRHQIRDLVKSGKFDEAKVRAFAKGQSDIISDIIVEKVRMKSRMYAVLTPEQRTKAEQLHEQWNARMKEHEHKD
jgi:Spy/CpxP family protein refolding chaperone